MKFRPSHFSRYLRNFRRAVGGGTVARAFWPKKPKGGGPGKWVAKAKAPKGIKHKHRFKYPGKYKNKIRNIMDGISQHNDLSTVNLGTVKVGKQRRIKSVASFKYIEGKEGIARITGGPSGAGAQVVFDLPRLLTLDQMNGTNLSNSRFDTNAFSTWEMDPMKYNPYAAPPNSGYFTNVTTNIAAGDKLAILHCTHKIYLVSLENAPMEVELYYLTPKGDIDHKVTETFVNDTSALNLGQAGTITDSAVGGVNARGGTVATDRYGYQLMSNALMKKHFKLLKSTKFVLQPGDRRTLKLTFNFNKVVTKQTLSERTSFHWANWTVMPVIVTRGALTGIAATAGGDATEVTFAPSKIGFVTENHWTFGALSPNRFDTNRVFPPYLVNATIANMTELNDTDIKVAITEV